MNAEFGPVMDEETDIHEPKGQGQGDLSGNPNVGKFSPGSAASV